MDFREHYQKIRSDKQFLKQLQTMTLPQLYSEAERLKAGRIHSRRKPDIISRLIKEKGKKNGVIHEQGALEILPDGFGFLRLPVYDYLPSPDDIYVSPSQIRKFGLRTGAIVSGKVRPPKRNERFFALLKIDMINYCSPEMVEEKMNFEDLTPLYPQDKIVLEQPSGDLSTRIIDLLAPLGKGQRGLIVASPKSGKTVLLQKIAQSISENHPNIYLLMLLVDERPEEVSDMERSVKGEVISSSFDKSPEKHRQIVEMVLERAKRLVESGHDVFILLDSITRLARAYNKLMPSSGRTLTGGLDANALQYPKKFFGSARNIENGGSLTILATALIDTGSRMDDVIFEEFKGSGNMELYLSRKAAERRIFPAINVTRSGTRREEALIPPEQLKKIWKLRRVVNSMSEIDSIEFVIDKLEQTRTNDEFFENFIS